MIKNQKISYYLSDIQFLDLLNLAGVLSIQVIPDEDDDCEDLPFFPEKYYIRPRYESFILVKDNNKTKKLTVDQYIPQLLKSSKALKEKEVEKIIDKLKKEKDKLKFFLSSFEYCKAFLSIEINKQITVEEIKEYALKLPIKPQVVLKTTNGWQVLYIASEDIHKEEVKFLEILNYYKEFLETFYTEIKGQKIVDKIATAYEIWVEYSNKIYLVGKYIEIDEKEERKKDPMYVYDEEYERQLDEKFEKMIEEVNKEIEEAERLGIEPYQSPINSYLLRENKLPSKKYFFTRMLALKKLDLSRN